MARRRHPNKEIEAALQYAESEGWRVVQSRRGHNWGRMYCPFGARGGCQKSIHSTPRVPHDHAERLRQAVDACQH
jgi:hypothetical protein